jgi:hypothetical protein
MMWMVAPWHTVPEDILGDVTFTHVVLHFNHVCEGRGLLYSGNAAVRLKVRSDGIFTGPVRSLVCFWRT